MKLTKVSELKVGELVHVYYEGTCCVDDAGPFIRAENSLIDKNGWNWYLCECKDLDTIHANADEMTWDQANEFRLQILSYNKLQSEVLNTPIKPKYECKVVAIVGKIASGKSTALKYFKELGYSVISADAIVSELYERKDVIKLLSRYFNSAYLDGTINKQILRELIKDPKNKAKLESIIHPLVEKELLNRLSNLTGLVFIEVPLLFEAHLDYLADYILAIDADEETIRKHLTLRHVNDIEGYIQLNSNVNFDNYRDKIDYFVKPNDDIKVFYEKLHEVLNKNILEKIY